MDASCGPGNALSQLTKHTQRDNSLHHERQQNPGDYRQNVFRNGPGLDANLNQDFHQFRQGHFSEVQPSSIHHQNIQVQPISGGVYAQNQGLYQSLNQGPNQGLNQSKNQGQNQAWVQDFSGLSLENQQRAQFSNVDQTFQQKSGQAQGQKSDWHLQFMQNMRQQQNGQTSQHQGQHQNQFDTADSRFSYQPMMNQFGAQQNGAHMQKEAQDLQQNSLHSPQVDEQALSRQFDMIERELEHAEQAASKVSEEVSKPEVNAENEHFAEAARQVHSSMVTGNANQSSETASKFQQSNFLKLMTSISERQVELSKEGDKLVETTSGADIRQHLSDPLKHERNAEPDYHVPQHESLSNMSSQNMASQNMASQNMSSQNIASYEAAAFPQKTNESQNIRSHLPDPLAHIRDGALGDDLSSLQAAQVISGGQVQENAWMEDEMWDFTEKPAGRKGPSLMSEHDQEVYDDYRNDDY